MPGAKEYQEYQASFDESGNLRKIVMADGLDGNFQTPADFLPGYFDKLNAAKYGHGTKYAIPTGHIDLDRLGGLPRRYLTILGGIPNVGKSTFALHLALHAVEAGITVAFFSAEMSEDWVSQRMLSIMSGVDSYRVSQMILAEREMAKLARARANLESRPMYVDYTDQPTLEDIRAGVGLLKEKKGVGLVIIDRIEKIKDRKGVVEGLKDIASFWDVAVLATTAQIKKPDLDGYRNMEYNAQEIWFLDREELHNPDTERKGIADLHVVKSKVRPPFSVQMLFVWRTGQFIELAPYRE